MRPLRPARFGSGICQASCGAANAHLDTSRLSSTIAALRVDAASGGLTYVSTTPTEQQPRGFAIDPTGRYLIAAGEKSDKLSVYAIDSSDGSLRLLGRHAGGLGASWIEIVGF